jgi:hypothetical protein
MRLLYSLAVTTCVIAVSGCKHEGSGDEASSSALASSGSAESQFKKIVASAFAKVTAKPPTSWLEKKEDRWSKHVFYMEKQEAFEHKVEQGKEGQAKYVGQILCGGKHLKSTDSFDSEEAAQRATEFTVATPEGFLPIEFVQANYEYQEGRWILKQVELQMSLGGVLMSRDGPEPLSRCFAPE